jgi:23S rRNA (guanosine2251-2'-O)-methyltransferase
MEIIYGRHPVLDALAAENPIDKVLLLEGTRGELEVEMRQACKKAGVQLQYIPKERFARYTRENHQGVIALMSALPNYHSLKDLLPAIIARGEVPLLVILDGITDVRNFGAIARSAEAAGAHGLIVAMKGVAHINAEAMKASAGALATLPVCRESSLSAVLDMLGLEGIQVLASDLKGHARLQDIDMNEPTAFIVGSESEGVSHHLLQRADSRFKLPMNGTTDSYNASVAAGMMLYEVLRQRLA